MRTSAWNSLFPGILYFHLGEIYFVGLIDILCEYGLKKQLEHHYKAAKHGESVGNQNFSVVDPVQYSDRFQKFVADALV